MNAPREGVLMNGTSGPYNSIQRCLEMYSFGSSLKITPADLPQLSTASFNWEWWEYVCELSKHTPGGGSINLGTDVLVTWHWFNFCSTSYIEASEDEEEEDT